MIRRQRTVWREWCARPQTTDQEFLRGCGLPGEDPLSRKLALATRYALAEASGVPPGTVKADDPFRHEIWDSLDWLDVIFRIEKAVAVKIPGGGAREVLYRRRDEGRGTVVADFVRAVLVSARTDTPRARRVTSPL